MLTDKYIRINNAEKERMKMENNKNFAITKLTAVFMAVIMVLSAGITPVLAAEEGDV